MGRQPGNSLPKHSCGWIWKLMEETPTLPTLSAGSQSSKPFRWTPPGHLSAAATVPLVLLYITIENGSWTVDLHIPNGDFPSCFQMVIFHSYLSLQEGSWCIGIEWHPSMSKPVMPGLQRNACWITEIILKVEGLGLSGKLTHQWKITIFNSTTHYFYGHFQ